MLDWCKGCTSREELIQVVYGYSLRFKRVTSHLTQYGHGLASATRFKVVRGGYNHFSPAFPRIEPGRHFPLHTNINSITLHPFSTHAVKVQTQMSA